MTLIIQSSHPLPFTSHFQVQDVRTLILLLKSSESHIVVDALLALTQHAEKCIEF